MSSYGILGGGGVRLLKGTRVLSFLVLFLIGWSAVYAGEPIRVNQAIYKGKKPLELSGSRRDGKSPDLPQAPGWPQELAVGSTWKDTKGVAFADLDGDGNLEIITGTNAYRVYVWNYLGDSRPGWPQMLSGRVLSGVAVGDVNADGLPNIVAAVYNPQGLVYVFDRDGNVLPGWPASFGDHYAAQTPTLSDLDGDGKLEIIVGERALPQSWVHVLTYDGTEFPGNWPVELDHGPGTGAAVGDIDNDGEKEIIYCSLQSIYAFESDGTIVPGWPCTPSPLTFYRNAPALADFDEDGYLEIVCSSTEWNKTFILDHQGNFLPGWPRDAPASSGPPSVGDIDRDGDLEIVVGNYPPPIPDPFCMCTT
ncbi:MAG: VCBS repeat-containing protein [Candidatus Zixiibacteriota bacterium]